MSGISKTFALAFDQHTISTTALALVDLDFTQTQIDATNRVAISVRSGSVNVRYDGTAPTVSVGLTFYAGDIFTIEGNIDIQNLKMIRNGGTDAVVDVMLES